MIITVGFTRRKERMTGLSISDNPRYHKVAGNSQLDREALERLRLRFAHLRARSEVRKTLYSCNFV